MAQEAADICVELCLLSGQVVASFDVSLASELRDLMTLVESALGCPREYLKLVSGTGTLECDEVRRPISLHCPSNGDPWRLVAVKNLNDAVEDLAVGRVNGVNSDDQGEADMADCMRRRTVLERLDSFSNLQIDDPRVLAAVIGQRPEGSFDCELVKRVAVKLLSPQAVKLSPELVACLGSDSWRTRASALDVIRIVAEPGDERAIDGALALLEDPHVEVRANAIMALHILQDEGPEAVHDMVHKHLHQGIYEKNSLINYVCRHDDHRGGLVAGSLPDSLVFVFWASWSHPLSLEGLLALARSSDALREKALEVLGEKLKDAPEAQRLRTSSLLIRFFSDVDSNLRPAALAAVSAGFHHVYAEERQHITGDFAYVMDSINELRQVHMLGVLGALFHQLSGEQQSQVFDVLRSSLQGSSEKTRQYAAEALSRALGGMSKEQRLQAFSMAISCVDDDTNSQMKQKMSSAIFEDIGAMSEREQIQTLGFITLRLGEIIVSEVRTTAKQAVMSLLSLGLTERLLGVCVVCLGHSQELVRWRVVRTLSEAFDKLNAEQQSQALALAVSALQDDTESVKEAAFEMLARRHSALTEQQQSTASSVADACSGSAHTKGFKSACKAAAEKAAEGKDQGSHMSRLQVALHHLEEERQVRQRLAPLFQSEGLLLV